MGDDDNRKQIPKVLEFVNVKKKNIVKLSICVNKNKADSKEKIFN